MFWSQKHEVLDLPTKSDLSTHLDHCGEVMVRGWWGGGDRNKIVIRRAAAEETVIDACHLFPRNPEWNDMLKHCNLQSVIHIHYSFMLDSPLPTWQSDKIRNVNITAPLWEIGYRLDVVILGSGRFLSELEIYRAGSRTVEMPRLER